MRTGRRSRGGDDRPLSRARARPDPGHRRARGLRPGRVRRLADAAPRLRHVAARGRAGVRDRLRGGGFPRRRGDAHGDRARDGAARDLARLARAVPPTAKGGDALSQPGARRHVSADRRRGARRLARGRDRARSTGVLHGFRRRGDPPVLRGGGRLPHRRRPRRLGGDGRACHDATTTAGSPSARPGRGDRGRSRCSSSRCSRDSTCDRSRRPSSSTS